ncbi:MAG: hypothetical protein LBC52_03735 [Treponema sp.]|jgi:hypothetical protein|nr:hypothetical protein [Treponema sp.]
MINRRQLRKLMVILAVIGVMLLIACLGIFSYFWPRPAWIIEDRYIKVWEKVIADSPSPLPKAKIIPASVAEARMSRSWYGYRIDSKYQPPATGENESSIRVYPEFRSGNYGEAFPLALDPWLVFRKFTSPPLTRAEAENGSGGKELILLAGGDRAAVTAWIAQLVQRAPGVFSFDEELWEKTEAQLLRGNFFQHGAMTYGWVELWPRLLGGNEDVRVYAPLSRIRQLPTHQTNILEADVFPGRRDWDLFGFQTDIMWAVPFGNQGRQNREKLKPVEKWLRSAELQTLLADTLGWLSAHPESPPFNPVTGSARIYYLTASYLWTIR